MKRPHHTPPVPQVLATTQSYWQEADPAPAQNAPIAASLFDNQAENSGEKVEKVHETQLENEKKDQTQPPVNDPFNYGQEQKEEEIVEKQEESKDFVEEDNAFNAPMTAQGLFDYDDEPVRATSGNAQASSLFQNTDNMAQASSLFGDSGVVQEQQKVKDTKDSGISSFNPNVMIQSQYFSESTKQSQPGPQPQKSQ